MDTQANFLAHSNQDAIGQNFLDKKDASGRFIFREMIEMAKSDGKGHINYNWPKSDHKKMNPKSGYFRYFKTLGLDYRHKAYMLTRCKPK